MHPSSPLPHYAFSFLSIGLVQTYGISLLDSCNGHLCNFLASSLNHYHSKELLVIVNMTVFQLDWKRFEYSNVFLFYMLSSWRSHCHSHYSLMNMNPEHLAQVSGTTLRILFALT